MSVRRIILIAVVAVVVAIAAFLVREEVLTQARWRAAENAGPLDSIITGSYMLVGDQASSSLSVVEAVSGRIVGAIPVPEGPHELAVSPDGRFAVAALAGDAGSWRPPWRAMRTIAVIDLTATRPLRMVDLGAHAKPHGVVFVDERTAAVTSQASTSIVFIDCLEGTILGAVDVGEGRPTSSPHMLAISEDRRRVYSANMDSHTVAEIDGRERKVLRHVSFSGSPVAVTVPSDGTLWAIQQEEGEIYRIAVVDMTTGKMVSHLTDVAMPRRIAVVPDHSLVVVTDPGRHEVQVYDVATRALKSRIALDSGAGPSGIAFAPGTSSAFIALAAGKIAEVDYREGRVVRTIDTPGLHPDGIAYIPRGQ